MPVVFDSFLIFFPAEYASGTAIEKNNIFLKHPGNKKVLNPKYDSHQLQYLTNNQQSQVLNLKHYFCLVYNFS